MTMTCEQAGPNLVARLYGELAEHDGPALEAHLAACASCRETEVELRETRGWMRDAAPEVPLPPRVWVVGDPGRRRGLRGFAAGFACAAALMLTAAGLAWFARGAWNAPETSLEAAAGTPDAFVAAVDERLDGLRRDLLEREREIARLEAEFARNADARADGSLQTRVAALERAYEERRRDDIDYILGEIAAAERRTGRALGQTERSMRDLVLASNPALSEF